MMNRRTALGIIACAFVPGTLRAADREPDFLRPLLDAKSLPELGRPPARDPARGKPRSDG